MGLINAEDVIYSKKGLGMAQLAIFTYMGVGEPLNRQSPWTPPWGRPERAVTRGRTWDCDAHTFIVLANRGPDAAKLS